ncbi:ATP-dependent DNA helicase [Naematelia encephala]|uniref:DNA 3'-5' helicase n=1 Tax=Naematelia encephala TaxID=71784 RepID=A0A1Y2ATF7_9TREE|nr:ATP-dependent DNA helicase [Naematelia encephala]
MGQPIEMDRARQVLKSTFGYPNFRQSQEPVLDRLLGKNQSALAIFPTGGGKSLCYQIPGVILPGLTIVISPLLSLMKDQVDVLRRKGVKAASLDSSLDPAEAAAVRNGVRSGDLKILYVAPERLNNEGFIKLLDGITISLLAIDEAHCVSEWGPSFRPEYLKVARFSKEINAERILALTATATRAVEEDICRGFDIALEGVFRIPMYRSNLHISTHVASSLQDKLQKLGPMLRRRTGPAIVYVTLQKQAEQVSSELKKRGVEDCRMYHAGMKTEDRKDVQDWFMSSKAGVVCATIAFAMGIDKNDIRQIHHLMMPKSLENWTQEIGRAGRDGKVSECHLFLCPTDVPVLEGFARADACSLMVLRNWLTEVWTTPVDEDGTVAFNLYQQSKEYDIRQGMLNILFALMELDYGLLRATTPFYEIYKITPKDARAWTRAQADNGKAAVAVRKCWRKTGASYELNMVDISSASGVPRYHLAGVINSWEVDNAITAKPSQVRAQFKMLKPDSELPSTPEQISELALKLAKVIQFREEKELERMKRVIDISTGSKCFAFALAEYFGDQAAIPDGKCDHCSYCKTHTSLDFHPIRKPPSRYTIQAILKACGVRDDSHVLARMAFGISSPRLSQLGMQKHPLFGSCDDCDYEMLLNEFEIECSAAQGKNIGSDQSKKTATKRVAQVTNTTSATKKFKRK